MGKQEQAGQEDEKKRIQGLALEFTPGLSGAWHVKAICLSIVQVQTNSYYIARVDSPKP
jgi:hypothetical protein